MNTPENIETERLRLRRPNADDADSIFSRYASDLEVTRFVGWPRHCHVGDTHAFLAFSIDEWKKWPAGPYLVESLDDGRLLGSTGLNFETSDCAMTGYVLARDAWGMGYATEALRAMVDLAPKLGLLTLYALCHPDHNPSQHVLEKCGFGCEARLRDFLEFPNLKPGVPSDVLRYTRQFS